MKNKAQATSLSEMLTGLITIGLIGMLVFFFITRGQEMQVRVEENEILRRKIILINILLSSDKFAYSDDLSIHRGILDKQKLDNIQSNPSSLYSEISYSNAGYYVKIIDLNNNNQWIIGKDFEPSFKSPVAIRYSDDEIHIGVLAVEFTKEFEVPISSTTIPPEICYQGNIQQKIKEVENALLKGNSKYPNYLDNLLLGIALAESGPTQPTHCIGNKVFINKATGAIGAMQIMPDMGRDVCGYSKEELMNWEKNIECGAKVLLAKYDAYFPKTNLNNKKDLNDYSYDPLDCGYYYTDPWKRAVRGYNGWGCVSAAPGTKQYVCTVYEKAGIVENPPVVCPV